MNKLLYSDIINWSSQSGGNELFNYWIYGTDNFGDPYGCFTISYNQWDTNGNGTSQSASTYYWASDSPPSLGSPVPFSGGQTTFTTGLQGQLSALAGPPGTVTQSASTRFNVATDGLSQPGYYSLFQISSSGNAYAAIDPTYYWDDWSNMPSPPPVKVGGYTLNTFQRIGDGSSGYYCCNLAIPAGEQVDMTALSPTYAYYDADTFVNPITITALTVVSNATQINSSTNWVTVKCNGGYVTLQASLSTNDPNLAPFIHWSCGQPVPGQPFQRQVSTSVATNFTVTASSGSSSATVSVWVIWADLKIKTSGTLDPDDHAAVLVNGSWPTPTNFNVKMYGGSGMGGGNGLGPIDSLSNTNLNYAFAIGKIEAIATIHPSGVAKLITNGWILGRSRISLFCDNGSISGSDPSPGTADFSTLSIAASQYLDTTNGFIFDLDAPGCSSAQGTNINHTADVYDNFEEYLFLTLNGQNMLCSDQKAWSYSAQIDIDATNKVQRNTLSTNLIFPFPTNSAYNPR